MERFTGDPGETSSIQAEEQGPFERLDRSIFRAFKQQLRGV